MQRRRFMLKAGGVLAAAGAAAVNAPNVIAQPKVQWRMPTYWAPGADIALGAPQKLSAIRAARI